jgi:8-oxo-dGTP pyrophosphatase MutT (NUDIX family)
VPQTRVRHAARVLLVDDRGRVLLFRFGPNHQGRYFWICPGGGLEAGETHEQAAHRELMEEVELDGVELGPCRWEREYTFDWFERRVCQRERWYLVRCTARELDAAHLERLRSEGIHDARWWSLPELEDRPSGQYFIPRHLAALVADVLAGHLPTEVTRLAP